MLFLARRPFLAPFLQLLLRVGLSMLVVLGTSTQARAQSDPTGICSAVNVPGAISTTAEGINNAGAIVGTYIVDNGGEWIMRGYISSGGQITTLSVPDSLWTSAFGINDAGVVVGTYGPATPVCNCVDDIEVYGFRYSAGVFTTISVGLSQTWPLAINNTGTIVGSYNDRDGDIEDAKRGFLLSASGGLTRIDGPGGGPLTEITTIVRGINDDGVAVGFYGSGGFGIGGGQVYGGARGFKWQDGVLTELRHPEAPESTGLYGISNSGTIIGTYSSATDPEATSFTFADNRFTKFDCFEPTEDAPSPPPPPDLDLPASGPSLRATPQSGPGRASVTALNHRSALIGNRYINGTVQGFYSRPITFWDPVGEFMLAQPDATTINAHPQMLAEWGRRVYAIAADGVSQVVVRIPVAAVGEMVTVSIYKDKTVAAGNVDMNEYGTVGTPGSTCPGSGCEFVQVTVAAQNTNFYGPMAFVLYRAPLDFVRSPADANRAFRDLYLRVQGSTGSATISLRVIRPPVALIHGIWSSAAMWNNFAPYANRDGRFAFKTINYGTRLAFMRTDPVYAFDELGDASSLGVEYNAPRVLSQLNAAIKDFRTGNNPVNLPAAAVQADVVVHSLGGVMTRSLPLYKGFKADTLGHGLVHKLITINTPHLGSPLASRFMEQTFLQRCVAHALTAAGSLIIRKGRAVGTGWENGAVFDLSENSPALQALLAPGVRAFPTALVTSRYTQWSSMTTGLAPNYFRFGCPYDSIAQSMTATGWPLLMGGDNDGVVNMNSQKAGIAAPPFEFFEGRAHTDALRPLGFKPPFITKDVEVSDRVIELLNTSYRNQLRYICVPEGRPCGQ